MNKQLFLGTYEVPPISNENLGASFTTPGNMSKEIFENIVFCVTDNEESEPAFTPRHFSTFIFDFNFLFKF